MSYEEKGAWVYLVVTLGVYGAYVGIVFRRAAGVPITEVAYRAPLLWSMGIAIALSIVGRIVVEMAKPSETYRLDARDKDINRFGEYVGGSVLAIGMLAPFVLAIAEADHFWIANAMYAVFAVSALVGTTTRLIAYRRGL